MLGETKSWADIPETFLLKEYHKYLPIKRRSVFFQLKKWKTKLCFPWFRNDAFSRLMVHLFTNPILCPFIQNANQPCRISDEMFYRGCS